MFACCIVCFCWLFFACLFVCFCGCHAISTLCYLPLFIYIFTYLRSFEMEFSTIILLQFNVFLYTGIFVYNLVLFIYFVFLFISLLVNTCIIIYMFLQFVALIILNTCLWIYICIWWYIYMLIYLSFTFTIFTVQYLFNLCKCNILLFISFVLLFIYLFINVYVCICALCCHKYA